jgi:hypothetical protein
MMTRKNQPDYIYFMKYYQKFSPQMRGTGQVLALLSGENLEERR